MQVALGHLGLESQDLLHLVRVRVLGSIWLELHKPASAVLTRRLHIALEGGL